MKRILATIILWCSAVACAMADQTPSNFTDMAQSSTDLSIKYLGQIFGNVPGALSGGGSGLMGQLFYVFNQGVMVVAAVWLVYSISNIVISTALHSQGPSRFNVALIMLRVAVGMSLLVPSSNTGYSVVQELMMQVVIQGTKLADTAWDYALDYLANGGVIYERPKSTNAITDISQLNDYIANGSSDNPRSGLIRRLYLNQVCMFVSAAEKQQSFDMIPVPPSMGTDGKTFDNTTGRVYFPGGNDTPNASARGQSCGYIGINSDFLNADNADELQYRQAYAALYQMAMDIRPLAQSMAQLVVKGEGDEMGPNAGGSYLKQAILDYVHLMKPVAAYQAEKLTDSHADFVDYAKEQGWFDAGSFYWNLSRWNDALTSSGDPVSMTPDMFDWAVDGDIAKKVTLADNKLGGSADGSVWGNAINQLKNYIGGQMHNNAQTDVQEVNKTFDTDGADYNHVLQTTVAFMVKKFEHVMKGQNASDFDPMVFVQHIGRACLGMAGAIWSYTMNWAHNWAVVAGVCSAVNPGGTLVNAVMSWAVPIWTMAATALFGAGFLLNFYVPLYPYLLFMFGGLGWLLYVVEAMVAAPLVCFGMTHPEGHDFMGKAEQALMLALSVFLRPALMIIGFLAGMLMSYVAFNFVNTVLGRVFISAFALHPGSSTHGTPVLDAVWRSLNGSPHNGQAKYYTGSAFADFLLIPLLLVTYGLIVVEVVNQCFSAIHAVPDMILRWIGGPVQQDQSERYAQAIRGGMSQASQQVGRLGSEAISGSAKESVAVGQDAGRLVGGVGGATTRSSFSQDMLY